MSTLPPVENNVETGFGTNPLKCRPSKRHWREYNDTTKDTTKDMTNGIPDPIPSPTQSPTELPLDATSGAIVQGDNLTAWSSKGIVLFSYKQMESMDYDETLSSIIFKIVRHERTSMCGTAKVILPCSVGEAIRIGRELVSGIFVANMMMKDIVNE